MENYCRKLIQVTFIFLGVVFVHSEKSFATPSLNGLNVPALTQIYDSQSHAWTINSEMQVLENGKAVPGTANAILLLYFNGVVYQQNMAHLWYAWDPKNSKFSQVTDPRTFSANSTSITSGKYIVDGQRHVWTIDGGSIKLGSSTTPTWISTDATKCLGSGSWSGSLGTGTNLTRTIKPAATGTYNYTVTCSNATDSTEGTLTVMVSK